MNIELAGCAQDFMEPGVKPAKCIDGALISRISGAKVTGRARQVTSVKHAVAIHPLILELIIAAGMVACIVMHYTPRTVQ
jgi:hypothetical protein